MIALQFGLSLVFFVLFIGYFLTADARKRMRLSLALTASLVALCLSSLLVKGEDGQWKIKIKPGLDLKGGTQFLLELAGDADRSAVDQAVEVIRKRVDTVGVAEPVIQPVGEKRIIVQIPGVSETDKASYRRQLEKVAKLEFALVHPENDSLIEKAAGKSPEVSFEYQVLKLRDRDRSGSVVETPLS